MSTATRDVVCKQTVAGTIEVSEETAARHGLSRDGLSRGVAHSWRAVALRKRGNRSAV